MVLLDLLSALLALGAQTRQIYVVLFTLDEFAAFLRCVLDPTASAPLRPGCTDRARTSSRGACSGSAGPTRRHRVYRAHFILTVQVVGPAAGAGAVRG